MAWTGFPTWIVGQISTASDWNTYIAANATFLSVPPMWRVYRTAASTGSSANPAPYDTKTGAGAWDSTGGYSVSTFKYTVSVAGYYTVIASWGQASVVDGGYLNAYIYHNGSVSCIVLGQDIGAAGNASQSAQELMVCVVGDTINGGYNASTSLAAEVGQTNMCWFAGYKVSN